MKDFKPLFEAEDDQAQDHQAQGQSRHAKPLSFTPFVPSEEDSLNSATVPLSQNALETLLKERNANKTMTLNDAELEELTLRREGMDTPSLGLAQVEGIMGQEGSDPGINLSRSGAIEGVSKTKPGQTGKDLKIKLVAAPEGLEAQPETVRMPPSELRKLSTLATPLVSMDGKLAEGTAGKLQPLFPPVFQKKKPQARRQNKLIAVALGFVFVLVGAAIGWMAIP